jgi:intracellular multiplication protein IcmG
MADKEEFSYDENSADEYQFDDEAAVEEGEGEDDATPKQSAPPQAGSVSSKLQSFVQKLSSLTSQQKIILVAVFLIVCYLLARLFFVSSPGEVSKKPSNKIKRVTVGSGVKKISQQGKSLDKATPTAAVLTLKAGDKKAVFNEMFGTSASQKQKMIPGKQTDARLRAPGVSGSQQQIGQGQLPQQAVQQQQWQQQKAPMQQAAKTKSMEEASARLDQRLSQVLQQQSMDRQSLQTVQQSLNTRLNSLEQSQQNLIRAFNQLSSKVGSMTTQMKQGVGQARAHAAPTLTREVPKAMLAKPIVKRTSYFVEAVVPGRAWLQTSNGRTVTVTIGERLNGYGLVTLIDPYTGNVKTSSGAMIRYGMQTR